MSVSKQFLTFTQQVDYLKNEKGITISNDQFAEDTLQRIGYFVLMGGYKELFRIPFSKNISPELLLMGLLPFISLMPDSGNCF